MNGNKTYGLEYNEWCKGFDEPKEDFQERANDDDEGNKNGKRSNIFFSSQQQPLTEETG